MIDVNKRKAIFLLHNEGMGIREISRNLKISTNTVSKIINQKGQMPETIRQDKINVDPALLRQLHAECDGYVQRIHEKLAEEEGIEIGYSTLTRNIRELGLGQPKYQRCDHIPDVPGAEMQHEFPELLEILYQSMADHTQARVLKTFESYDCLLVDELGFIETDPVQVGLFFSLMHKRHKKKTTLITSNLGFEQWGSFLKNKNLTAALIDRLTENSHVINMKNCKSLRTRLDQQ